MWLMAFPLPGEVAVPEQVIVSMAGIAESAKEGLLALAVGTGLQVKERVRRGRPTWFLAPDGVVKYIARRRGGEPADWALIMLRLPISDSARRAERADTLRVTCVVFGV
jgi:putative transposase